MHCCFHHFTTSVVHCNPPVVFHDAVADGDAGGPGLLPQAAPVAPGEQLEGVAIPCRVAPQLRQPARVALQHACGHKRQHVLMQSDVAPQLHQPARAALQHVCGHRGSICFRVLLAAPSKTAEAVLCPCGACGRATSQLLFSCSGLARTASALLDLHIRTHMTLVCCRGPAHVHLGHSGPAATDRAQDTGS